MGKQNSGKIWQKGNENKGKNSYFEPELVKSMHFFHDTYKIATKTGFDFKASLKKIFGGKNKNYKRLWEIS